MELVETWRPVFGYEGLYEVSDAGRVRSVSRTTRDGIKKQTTRGAIKSQMSNGNGYLSVRLYKGGKEKIVYVHRLVAAAFILQENEGLCVCHCDGDRANNAAQNLRWDTVKNNHADKVMHGTLLNGERIKHSKITEKMVIEIRERLLRGEQQKDIAVIFGISQPSVSDINKRRTWKHI